MDGRRQETEISLGTGEEKQLIQIGTRYEDGKQHWRKSDRGKSTIHQPKIPEKNTRIFVCENQIGGLGLTKERCVFGRNCFHLNCGQTTTKTAAIAKQGY